MGAVAPKELRRRGQRIAIGRTLCAVPMARTFLWFVRVCVRYVCVRYIMADLKGYRTDTTVYGLGLGLL